MNLMQVTKVFIFSFPQNLSQSSVPKKIYSMYPLISEILFVALFLKY